MSILRWPRVLALLVAVALCVGAQVSYAEPIPTASGDDCCTSMQCCHMDCCAAPAVPVNAVAAGRAQQVAQSPLPATRPTVPAPHRAFEGLVSSDPGHRTFLESLIPYPLRGPPVA